MSFAKSVPTGDLRYYFEVAWSPVQRFVNCLIHGLTDLSSSRRSRCIQGAEAIPEHTMLGTRVSTMTGPRLVLQVSYN